MRITRGDRTWMGSSEEVVFPGDRIQFGYSTKRAVQFALLHAGREKASVLFPSDDGSATVPIAAGEAVSLAATLELDNRAGDEQVFGLFCDSRVAVEPLTRALETTNELPQVPGCDVDELTLRRKLR
jgi:hypothetical protein